MTTLQRTGLDAACLVGDIFVAAVGPFEWLRVMALVLCGWYVRALAERLP